jgi:hypothetical protein
MIQTGDQTRRRFLLHPLPPNLPPLSRSPLPSGPILHPPPAKPRRGDPPPPRRRPRPFRRGAQRADEPPRHHRSRPPQGHPPPVATLRRRKWARVKTLCARRNGCGSGAPRGAFAFPPASTGGGGGGSARWGCGRAGHFGRARAEGLSNVFAHGAVGCCVCDPIRIRQAHVLKQAAFGSLRVRSHSRPLRRRRRRDRNWGDHLAQGVEDGGGERL